ncbi:MAG: hypothetical protein AAFO69_07650 [Bacteroidota bacterium]
MKSLTKIFIVAIMSTMFFACEQDEILPYDASGIEGVESGVSSAGSLTPLIVTGQGVYRGAACGTCYTYEGYVSATETRPYDRSVTVTYSSSVLGSSNVLVDQRTYTIKANQRLSANRPIFQNVASDFTNMKFKITSVANANGSSNNETRREINYGSIKSCSVVCPSGGSNPGGRQLFDIQEAGNNGGLSNPITGEGFE